MKCSEWADEREWEEVVKRMKKWMGYIKIEGKKERKEEREVKWEMDVADGGVAIKLVMIGPLKSASETF